MTIAIVNSNKIGSIKIGAYKEVWLYKEWLYGSLTVVSTKKFEFWISCNIKIWPIIWLSRNFNFFLHQEFFLGDKNQYISLYQFYHFLLLKQNIT